MNFFKKLLEIIILFPFVIYCNAINATDVAEIESGLNVLAVLNPNGMTSDVFKKETLNFHNEYRIKHGVPLLKLSEQLNEDAEQWAKYLASSEKFEHSNKEGLGENLFTKWSSDTTYSITAKEAVEAWYGEIGCYGFESTESFPVAVGKVGHFTQLVWKETTELGVGVGKSKSGSWYVVCNYKPPGNVGGQYQKNVVKPLDGDIKYTCSANNYRVQIKEFCAMYLFLKLFLLIASF